MKHNKTVLFILFVIFFSCENKQKTNIIQTKVNGASGKQSNQILHIRPDTFGKDELKLGLFASDVKYIPLSNETRLGQIINLRISENSIYVVSDKSSGGEGNGLKTLYKFDKDGTNPVQIGSVGKGAHEYFSSEFFVVDEKKGRIYINGRPNTVLVFDTNGKFLRSFRFEDTNQRYCKLGLIGNKYLFMAVKKLGANCDNLWTICDTLGNYVYQKKNTTPAFKTNLGPRGDIFQYGDKVSYWVNYNDSIFTIFPDFSYRASFVLKPGKYRYPLESIKISSMKEFLKKREEYYMPHFFMETNHYLISRCTFKGKYLYMFFDRQSQKLYSCNFQWNRDLKGGIPNNFDQGLMFRPKEYSIFDGSEYLVGTIEAYQLKSHITTKCFKNAIPINSEKKLELEMLAKSLNENDNPVLMLVKLKE